MDNFYQKKTKGLPNQSLFLLFDIIDQYNNFLFYCVDRCFREQFSNKYEKTIENIQIKGTECQRVQIPTITDDIDYLNDYFTKDLITCFANKNKNASFLFKKYITIGAKLIASYFFNDYPTKFDVSNFEPFVNYLNSLYSKANGSQENKKKIELEKITVNFEKIKNPNSYDRFLNVDVSKIDQYNTMKLSIEMYAERTSRKILSNLIKVLNCFYANGVNIADRTRKEINASYSSTFVDLKISDTIVKALNDFYNSIEKMEKGSEKVIDDYARKDNIIHSSDLKRA